MPGSKKDIWDGIAELVIQRTEDEQCQDNPVRLKKACRACVLEVIADAFRKIAGDVSDVSGKCPTCGAEWSH